MLRFLYTQSLPSPPLDSRALFALCGVSFLSLSQSQSLSLSVSQSLSLSVSQSLSLSVSQSLSLSVSQCFSVFLSVSQCFSVSLSLSQGCDLPTAEVYRYVCVLLCSNRLVKEGKNKNKQAHFGCQLITFLFSPFPSSSFFLTAKYAVFILNLL